MNNKKKMRNFVICMLCVICTLITFTPVHANAATKSLSNTKITLKFGNTKVLKLNNAKGKVTWKCSNAKIVSIKKKDAASITLTPKKQGNVTITASNNKKTYTCKVHVPKMKYDTWEDEKVMLGYTNTVTISDVHSPIQWSIDNKKIASIKAKGKNNYKLDITSLTHGETTIHAILDGTTYKMKVVVPEVKLDVTKIVWDGSKYYLDYKGRPVQYAIKTFYDENGNDITNTFDELFHVYLTSNGGTVYSDSPKGTLCSQGRSYSKIKTWIDIKFIGTDISTNWVEWKSSNPDSLITIGSDEEGNIWTFHGNGGKGSTTFTTQLGNETFSFDLEYDLCALPEQ